jgi:hypothetical protein
MKLFRKVKATLAARAANDSGGDRTSKLGDNCFMYEISSMEHTGSSYMSPGVVERLEHPEHGRFLSYEEAEKFADRIGDNYFAWPA